MLKRVLGLILCSVGTGMLIVIFIPCWGFLAAAVLVVIGCLLLFNRC